MLSRGRSDQDRIYNRANQLQQRARRELNPRPSDSKCIQELSTALFSPSQGLTIDNEDSGIHEVNHSNPSSPSQTLAAETKNFAALVLHDPELRAVSGGPPSGKWQPSFAYAETLCIGCAQRASCLMSAFSMLSELRRPT